MNFIIQRTLDCFCSRLREIQIMFRFFIFSLKPLLYCSFSIYSYILYKYIMRIVIIDYKKKQEF
jgi:hypothetical protein